MFRIQVTNTFRKSLWSCLRTYDKSDLYRSSYESIQLYSKALYSHKSIHYEYDQFQLNIDDANSKKINMKHHPNRRKKESSHEYLSKMFESPTESLRNIYVLVNKEFNNKEHLTFKYTEVDIEKTGKKKCTIDILWPTNMSFSYEDINKKAAASNAAKKCLTWLYNNKHIKYNRPILYSKDEIETSLSKPIKINLDTKFEDFVRNILNVYNNDIEPVMKKVHDVNCDQTKSPIDTHFENESFEKQESRNKLLFQMLRMRKPSIAALPILQYRSQILKSINDNQILLINGDTGCGKSTQVPQFIMDAYTEDGRSNECNIIVAEPRRISATSLAFRVTKERREFLGQVVGYQVRLHKKLPMYNGSILFCTTGIMLRKLQSNPTLDGISHVIIDEAHERSLQIDILLNLMKKLLTIKPDLKLIIMSATVNTELFQQYFSCASINVPGKMYPVKTHFIEDIEHEMHMTFKAYPEWQVPFYEMKKLIIYIAEKKPPGSILCFLPGWSEIQHFEKMLRQGNTHKFCILPFHSKLSHNEQQNVFCDVPSGSQKIILSTDIGESSITIKDVKYVVDSARKRNTIWNKNSSMYTVLTHYVSKANILQRKGRAGRISPGESYHMVTENILHTLNDYPEPEIHRLSLDKAVVISKTFSNGSAEDFFNNLIDKPNKTSLFNAVDYLKRLDILDENENLTPLGRGMMYFSLDVKLGKALILACAFKCLNPILAIVVMLSSDTETSVSSLISKVDRKNSKSRYHSSSDHIGLLEMFKSMQKYYDDSEIEIPTEDSQFKKYDKMKQIRQLYLQELISSGLISDETDSDWINVHSDENELIRSILFAASTQLLHVESGAFKKDYFTKTENTIKTEFSKATNISNASVNYKRKTWPSPFLTYMTQMEHRDSRRCLVDDTSIISPMSVLLFSQGNITCTKVQKEDVDGNNNVVIRIDYLKQCQFICDERSATLLLQLRSVLWDVVKYIIKYRNSTPREETNILNVERYNKQLLALILRLINDSAKNIDNYTDASE